MYGRYKRKRSQKTRSSAAKRRRIRGASSLQGFLRPQGIRSLLPSPSSYGPAGARNGNYASTWNVRQAGSWFPDRVRIPLKWTLDFTMSSTLGVGSQASFIANSISDPGGSTASTQPYGYDILIQMYNRYRVFASSIEVDTQVGPAGSVALANLPYQMIVWPSRVVTSFVSDPQGARQQPYGKDVLISNSNAQTNDKVIRNYIGTSKVFGVDLKTVASDDLFSSVVTSDPTNLWHWNIMCGVFGTASNSILVRCTIIMYAEMYQRVSLSST